MYYEEKTNLTFTRLPYIRLQKNFTLDKVTLTTH